MTPAPVVYRLQELWKKVEATRDYSSLAGFGRIITILDSEAPTSREPSDCLNRVCIALEGIRDGDFILWAGGDPLTAFMAGVACERHGVNHIQWLRWDRKLDPVAGHRTTEGRYSPVTVRLAS